MQIYLTQGHILKETITCESANNLLVNATVRNSLKGHNNKWIEQLRHQIRSIILYGLPECQEHCTAT